MEEAKEAFQQILKMAILFGGMAIFYVYIEKRILNRLGKKRNLKR